MSDLHRVISSELDSRGHDWHLLDIQAGIECRHLPGDVYELRTDTKFVTLDSTTFNEWLEDPDRLDIWKDAHSLEEINEQS